MASWAATQAKAKFSEVLDKAKDEGPQIVRRRKQVYLIMTKEEHDAVSKVAKLLHKGATLPKKYENLAEFFRNSPLAGVDLERDRVKLKPRHVDF